MTYTESGEDYIFFTDKEHDLIETWLKDHGFTYDEATVCGSCCGFYASEYWVNGIGGKFPKKSKSEFEKFATEHNIHFTFDDYSGNTIKAIE